MGRKPESQVEKDILIRVKRAQRKSNCPQLGATTRKRQTSEFKRQCKKLSSKGVCLKCEGII
ncbi:hypothetical protein UC8_27930 [Roseimaritima ulvae]|uniref:Uncharacterized protein n=1 Tax=Roseimaritima ulvae TaxID=980254 RepID=A0A5B9QTP1_9BACT|nr:hypothetical protein UC8_27930 [Roseimaritima ulvae]